MPEAEPGSLAELAGQRLTGTAETFPGVLWTNARAEAWLSLLGGATAADWVFCPDCQDSRR